MTEGEGMKVIELCNDEKRGADLIHKYWPYRK